MPKIITTEALLKEIDDAFTFVEMPSPNELSFHDADCAECQYLREDLEEYRDKKKTGELIRLIHQELSLFSAKAFRWILPYYLRYCLTSEAAYNQMETQFLIYNLGPEKEFQPETLQRLSLLTKKQIDCLISFLRWCFGQQYWKEFCPDSLTRGINFLQEISKSLNQRGRLG